MYHGSKSNLMNVYKVKINIECSVGRVYTRVKSMRDTVG